MMKSKDFCDNDFHNRSIILFLTQKKYRILRHCLFLIVFLALLAQGSFLDRYEDQDKTPILFFIFSFFVLMFYINMYFLIPRFLLKGQYLFYFFALFVVDVLGLCILAMIIKSFPYTVAVSPQVPNVERFFFDGVFLTIMLISTSTTIKLFQRWSIDVERLAELNKISLKLELDALKNQINPHFLFNMLNNIKSLTRKNPELASTVILKFSEFLRHQIYETNDKNVTLIAEIEFLTNFLDLEKIRRDNFKTDVQLVQEGTRRSNELHIPANLFTTFVENAVKHSIDADGAESFIHISFVVEDQLLSFICSNSKGSEEDQPVSHKNGGLGLINSRRRLELLFGDSYTLKISNTPELYSVILTIPI